MPARVFLTGGTGFVGSAVIDELLSRDCTVSALVRGKAPKDMRNKEDFWEVLDVVPGEPLMQKPDAFGCKLGDYT